MWGWGRGGGDIPLLCRVSQALGEVWEIWLSRRGKGELAGPEVTLRAGKPLGHWAPHSVVSKFPGPPSQALDADTVPFPFSHTRSLFHSHPHPGPGEAGIKEMGLTQPETPSLCETEQRGPIAAGLHGRLPGGGDFSLSSSSCFS